MFFESARVPLRHRLKSKLLCEKRVDVEQTEVVAFDFHGRLAFGCGVDDSADLGAHLLEDLRVVNLVGEANQQELIVAFDA